MTKPTLLNRVAKLEKQQPPATPRRQLDTMLISWLGLSPEARDAFGYLLHRMPEEEVAELQVDLHESIARGYDDFRRHEDTAYLAALSAACERVKDREDAHGNH